MEHEAADGSGQISSKKTGITMKWGAFLDVCTTCWAAEVLCGVSTTDNMLSG